MHNSSSTTPPESSSDDQLPSLNSASLEDQLPSCNTPPSNLHPPTSGDLQGPLPELNNLFQTTSPVDGKINYFPTDFFTQASQNKSIFPDAQPRKEKKTKFLGTEEVILYLAEIINIECHADIKCGKFKIGYIVRESLNSSHRSRLTHLTPFANFYW
jgi:hypothetical protein